MWRSVPLGAAVPFALVVLAAIAWSGVWYVQTAAIGERVAAWRAENAADGIALTCASEGAGGYPFRLSFECTDPVIELRAERAAFRVTAARLSAVALVYDPEHLIIEIDTPATIARAMDGVALMRAGRGPVRASAEIVDGALARMSVVAPALEFLPDEAPPLTVGPSELHLRMRPAEAALDIAVKSRNARVSLPDGGEPIEIAAFDLIAVINALPAGGVRDLDTWPARWQAGGGIADIKRLSLDAPELAGEAAGAVNLTPGGYLEGALNAKVRKIDLIAEALVRRGLIGSNDGQVLRGAAGLLAGVTGGQAAVGLPIRIRGGEVYLGPVKVAAVPPLI